MPPLPGSPVIDMGSDPDSAAFSYDERGPGYTRVSGDHVDVGATELQLVASGTPVNISSVVKSANGPFQLSINNDPGVSLRVLASTNLTAPGTNWSFIGFATENPSGSGHYSFADPQATNYKQRFYRVKSP